MALKERQLIILRAALARMVPADQDPGAVEVGAEVFIQGVVHERPEWLDVYLAGLQSLDELGFLELTSEQQDACLQRLESQGPFVGLLAQHAIEAFYTSQVGLEMVGFQVTG